MTTFFSLVLGEREADDSKIEDLSDIADAPPFLPDSPLVLSSTTLALNLVLSPELSELEIATHTYTTTNQARGKA